jgi:hypothetical protein
MNVSHEYKMIWWAPERTATKLTAQILKNYNFEYFVGKNNYKKLCDPYHSHDLNIPEGCENYKIICNMRNPYDRVLGLYLNFTSVGINSVFTRDSKEKFIKRFNYFVEELYHYAILTDKIVNLEREKPVKDYISSLNFENRIPDFFIRTENMVEDFQKIDFITQSDLWESGQIQEMIYNNNFKINRPFSFNEVYSFESANKVYQYQKKLFFICDYDPFSFTTDEINDESRKKFLHETF